MDITRAHGAGTAGRTRGPPRRTRAPRAQLLVAALYGGRCHRVPGANCGARVGVRLRDGVCLPRGCDRLVPVAAEQVVLDPGVVVPGERLAQAVRDAGLVGLVQRRGGRRAVRLEQKAAWLRRAKPRSSSGPRCACERTTPRAKSSTARAGSTSAVARNMRASSSRSASPARRASSIARSASRAGSSISSVPIPGPCRAGAEAAPSRRHRARPGGRAHRRRAARPRRSEPAGWPHGRAPRSRPRIRCARRPRRPACRQLAGLLELGARLVHVAALGKHLAEQPAAACSVDAVGGAELERPLEQRRRCLVRGELVRGPAPASNQCAAAAARVGARQAGRNLLRKARGALDRRSVMAADDLRERAAEPLEPPRQANVQVSALRTGKARVARIAEQCVSVRVDRAEHGVGIGTGHERPPLEHGEALVGVLDPEVLERVGREAAAGHGSSPHHLARACGQIVELRGVDRLHRARDRDLGRDVAQVPARVARDEHTTADPASQQLLDEERVAVGRGCDPVDERVAAEHGRPAPRELGRARRRERLQVDVSDPGSGLARQDGRCVRRAARPHSAVARVHEEGEQVAARPVDVLDDPDGGPPAASASRASSQAAKAASRSANARALAGREHAAPRRRRPRRAGRTSAPAPALEQDATGERRGEQLRHAVVGAEHVRAEAGTEHAATPAAASSSTSRVLPAPGGATTWTRRTTPGGRSTSARSRDSSSSRPSIGARIPRIARSRDGSGSSACAATPSSPQPCLSARARRRARARSRPRPRARCARHEDAARRRRRLEPSGDVDRVARHRPRSAVASPYTTRRCSRRRGAAGRPRRARAARRAGRRPPRAQAQLERRGRRRRRGRAGRRRSRPPRRR